MPHGTSENEKKYYHRRFFQNVAAAEHLDLKNIFQRKAEGIFERHNYYPMDFFFFTHNGIQYFGRKTVSRLYLEGRQSIKKCNQLTAMMIIGLVLRHQVLERGVTIFYKPLQDSEKVYLFNYLKNHSDVDVYFPFPVLTPGLHETVQTTDAWDPGEALPELLNVGEEHIRAYTLEFMSKFELARKIVYDPACSTGKFLGTIKEKFPEIYAIGQDMNPDMVKYCNRHSCLDEVHLGNSLYPCVEKESVDFIFFRFLNLSVVSSQQALQYFCKISHTCKIGGTMVVFGFTPVLLSAEIFELLGLKIEQKTAYSKENNSIFQYYVLEKLVPSITLRYENMSTFHFKPKPKTANLPEELAEATLTNRSKL